jgi:carbonic anhydrase
VTDELVRNAESYAASVDKGSLPLPPARRVAVLACMDARLNPYGLLGLSEGDAHVIRNAGGVVTDDEIRSLTFSDDEFRRSIQDDTGSSPSGHDGTLREVH